MRVSGSAVPVGSKARRVAAGDDPASHAIKCLMWRGQFDQLLSIPAGEQSFRQQEKRKARMLPWVDKVLLFGGKNKTVDASVAGNGQGSTSSDTVGEEVGYAQTSLSQTKLENNTGTSGQECIASNIVF